MKRTTTQKYLNPILVLLLTIFSLNSFSQNTFTVVCDKSDNSVKVVESHDRSPDYVPIKGGFPFRQVAEKWIDDNLSTRKCNPGDIIKQNQTQTKPASNITPPNKSGPTPQQHTTSVTGNQQKSLRPAAHFRNTSLILDAKFSNLGEAFNLENKLMPGFEAGIEQLFGAKFYFGTGINMDLYLSDFDSMYDLDMELIYFFRIPAFIGYRTMNNKMMVMYEAGVDLNSAFTGTELNLDSFGKTAKDNSVNFLGRMKIGTEQIMLELGSEIWLTDIFEADDFDMSTFYIGLRFFF